MMTNAKCIDEDVGSGNTHMEVQIDTTTPEKNLAVWGSINYYISYELPLPPLSIYSKEILIQAQTGINTKVIEALLCWWEAEGITVPHYCPLLGGVDW